MSLESLQEYITGEYQDIIDLEQLPATAGVDTWIRDQNGVKLGGYDIVIKDSASTVLTEGIDYELALRDDARSLQEGFSIWAGFRIVNPVYAGIPLFIDSKIVGGYTDRRYRPDYTEVDFSKSPFSTQFGARDLMVFVDTTDGIVQISLTDCERKNDSITIVATGPNVCEITGTGISGVVEIDNQATQFIWTGSLFVQIGGLGGEGGAVPPGDVTWFAGSGGIPKGKLVCDGAEYNISDYPKLNSVLGGAWNTTGDGITTFNVPNLSGIHPGMIGTQDINGNIKGDPAANIGDYLEDFFQAHWHDSYMASGVSDGGSVVRGIRGDTANGTKAGDNQVRGPSIDVDTGDAPRTGLYTDVSRAMGRWLIQAFDTVQEIPADPGIIKDWVEKFADESNTADVTDAWGVGLYKVITTQSASPGGNETTFLVNVRDTAVHNDSPTRDISAGNNYRARRTQVGVWTVAIVGSVTTPYIKAIYRWEDVAATDAQLNPPIDGWETLYEDKDSTNTSIANSWGDGDYRITVGRAGDDIQASVRVYVYRDLTPVSIGIYGSDSVGSSFVTVNYNTSTGNFDTFASGSTWYIKKIDKFNSLVNVVHSYQQTIYEFDTTAGDVDVSSYLDNPAVGRVLMFVNIGTGGNHLIGLPKSITLGDDKSLTLTYSGTAWRYEDVIIDEYSIADASNADVTHTVKKWAGGQMVVNSEKDATSSANKVCVFPEAFLSQDKMTEGGVSCLSYSTALSLTGVTFASTNLAGGTIAARCWVSVEGRWKAGI